MQPSIKSVDALLHGVAGQLHGARDDIDTLLGLVEKQTAQLEKIERAVTATPQVLRIDPLPSLQSLLPPPPPVPTATASRPSLAAQAGKKTVQVAPWVLVALGLVSEVAARHTASGGAFSAILKLVFPDAAP
jgi:hypothetical protein